MAGIGFELKKLFKDKGLAGTTKAYFYSIFVTIGPVVISVTTITFLQAILRYLKVDRAEMELMQATIMYSFMFAVIISSGYAMFISRYLADRLYEKRTEDFLPALVASIAFVLILCGGIGILFYQRSPLPIDYKLYAYLLFIGLIVQMLINVFVSAIKDYQRVAYGYFYGAIVGLFSGFLISTFKLTSITNTVIIGFDITIFTVAAVLANEVKRYFFVKSDRYLTFLKYFQKVASLILINTFYTMGLYSHFFVYWFFSDYAQVVRDTYLYAPYYDIPASYAFLTIMPTLVIFVVKIETVFYEKYRNYFYLINNGASYEDIRLARNEMKTVMYKEVVYIMEIQLFFTILSMILGMKFLSYVGFSTSMVDLFNILSLGYYCTVISFVVMTLLLYFNDKKSALIISGISCFGGFFVSLFMMQFGENFYGIGFFISALVSMIVAIIRMINYIRDIEFHIFCKQVSWEKTSLTVFERFIEKLNSLG